MGDAAPVRFQGADFALDVYTAGHAVYVRASVDGLPARAAASGVGICGGKDAHITVALLRDRVFPALNPTHSFEQMWTAITKRDGLHSDYPRLGVARMVLAHRLNYKCKGVYLNKAMAGVDGAFIDCKCAMERRSVCQVLGASRPGPKRRNCSTPRVYASSLSRDPIVSADEIRKVSRECGIRRFKIKAGVRNAGMVGVCAEEFDFTVCTACPDLDFWVDFNGALTGTVSANAIPALPENVSLIEEPFCHLETHAWDAFVGISNPKIGGMECLSSLAEFRRNIAKHAIDVVQLDFGYFGGPFAVHEALEYLTTHFPHKQIALHTPQPDLHLLMAVRFSKMFQMCGIEMCVLDDGLRQLDPTDVRLVGLIHSRMAVKDGYLRCENDTVGWGAGLDLSTARVCCSAPANKSADFL